MIRVVFLRCFRIKKLDLYNL